MGFLDRQSRVIDVVLTEHGRRLYSTGQLDFAYFSLLDDGIDYDPWTTGSFDDSARDAAVANALILEAPVLRDTRDGTHPLAPSSYLFTARGTDPIPHMVVPKTKRPLALSADQRQVTPGTYTRTGTSTAQIVPQVLGESASAQEGYIVRVYASGSDGLQELDLRKDLSGRRCYDPFIAVSIDSEVPIDLPKADKPQTTRLGLLTKVTK